MVEIKKHSGIYSLEVEQFLSTSMDKAWDFFSSPINLSKITPAEMGFAITSKNNEKAYPGQIITYKVGIFPFIKNNWVTEITQVKEKEYFIDEQRFGPYKMWHHEHRFKPVDDGVLMKDSVSYKLPYSFLGCLAHSLFIRGKLKKIFMFRYESLSKYFN